MYPVLGYTEHFGCAVGQINNAVLWHGPAIVDVDDYRLVILQVCNLDTKELRGAVRRGELIHIE
jgi:hypothetical protein